MPFVELKKMDAKMRFVSSALSGEVPFSELCGLYNISRETGYKWVRRYEEFGPAGLEELSRRPHSNSRSIGDECEKLIREYRERYGWGPRKIRALIGMHHPKMHQPAVSTIAALLKREGFIKEKRRKRRRPGSTRLREPVAANEVWSVDFKGEFRLGNRELCYPLTISDNYSRYLLGVQSLSTTSIDRSKPVFERVFREYGLPRYIRSDNGSPFSSRSPGGLTRLSSWWVRLGISLEHIRPGHPEENGKHERMHLTLKNETAKPPGKNPASQQRRFNRFKHRFNEERPHEGIGMNTPNTFYSASTNPYPNTLPDLEYPGHHEVRRVRSSGEIKWKGNVVYLSAAIIGEYVSLNEINEDHWLVNYGHVTIGELKRTSKSVLPLPPTNYREPKNCQ